MAHFHCNRVFRCIRSERTRRSGYLRNDCKIEPGLYGAIQIVDGAITVRAEQTVHSIGATSSRLQWTGSVNSAENYENELIIIFYLHQ